MVTPAGLDADSTCAAMRAGVQRLRETSYRDNHARLVVGAEVREIASRRKGLPRLVDLGAPALSEALSKAEVDDAENVALLLSVQEGARPSTDSGQVESLAGNLERAIGMTFRAGIEVDATGSAGGIAALSRARRMLRAGGVDAVVVGGVDSLLTKPTLAWYQAQNRLKQSTNPDGIIPGEGAAFTVWRNVWPHAHVHLTGVGFEHEPAHVTAQGPNRGEGMTRALRAALGDARLSAAKVSYRISDLSGERFGFVEHALAAIRVFTSPMNDCPHWHLASSIGSIGAAAGVALLGWAAIAHQRRYAPGPHALCLATSDTGLRAAAILTAKD